MLPSKKPTTGLKISESKILGIKKYKVFILILKIKYSFFFFNFYIF